MYTCCITTNLPNGPLNIELWKKKSNLTLRVCVYLPSAAAPDHEQRLVPAAAGPAPYAESQPDMRHCSDRLDPHTVQ